MAATETASIPTERKAAAKSQPSPAAGSGTAAATETESTPAERPASITQDAARTSPSDGKGGCLPGGLNRFRRHRLLRVPLQSVTE